MGLVGSHGEDPLQARNAVQVRGTAGRSRGTLGDGAGAFVSPVSHQRNRIIIPLPATTNPRLHNPRSLYPLWHRRITPLLESIWIYLEKHKAPAPKVPSEDAAP